jgi:hypothetical protein
VIQRPTDQPSNDSTGLSSGIALFFALIIVVVLAGCGAGGEDPGQTDEKAVAPGPPEIYPGVLDLPAATAEGCLRCSPGGAGPDGREKVAPGPAPLSREFVDAYRLRPPWEPEMPSFLPVDPEENERWMRLMELRSRFLFRRDSATGGWRPDAAASAELNVFDKELTVRLRDGLVWSDGSPASAADWVVAVEQIYQLPGVQSPLKAQTEAGGAVWRALDEVTIEVAFEAIPPDPLSVLAVPPLPLGDPRVASLAEGNIDLLFDLETAKDEIPTILRPGGAAGPSDSIPVLAEVGQPGRFLGSTGPGNRGLVLLVSSEVELSGVIEEVLDAARKPVSGTGLLLLPWEGGRPRRRAQPPQGAPGSDGPGEAPTPGRRLPPEVRIAYSFGSPGARGAAALFADVAEDRGAEKTTVVPENARVLDSELPRFLSGERPLPGDAVIIEVAVDPRHSVPVALSSGAAVLAGGSCVTDAVDDLDEWYNCIETELIEEIGALSGGPVRLVPLGLLPRLVRVSPGACFTAPVPYRARAIDLSGISMASEEEHS